MAIAGGIRHYKESSNLDPKTSKHKGVQAAHKRSKTSPRSNAADGIIRNMGKHKAQRMPLDRLKLTWPFR
jgi:hypothetical protein